MQKAICLLALSLSCIVMTMSSKYFRITESFTIPRTVYGDGNISDFQLIDADRFLLKINNSFSLWNRKNDSQSTLYRIQQEPNRQITKYIMTPEIITYFSIDKDNRLYWVYFNSQIKPTNQRTFMPQLKPTSITWISQHYYVLLRSQHNKYNDISILNTQKKGQSTVFNYFTQAPKLIKTGNKKFQFPYGNGVMSWHDEYYDQMTQFYIKDIDLTYLSLCSNDQYNVKLFRDTHGNHVLYQKKNGSDDYYIKSTHEMIAIDPQGLGLRCFNNNQTYQFYNDQLILTYVNRPSILLLKRDIQQIQLAMTSVPLAGTINVSYSQNKLIVLRSKDGQLTIQPPNLPQLPPNIDYIARVSQYKYFLSFSGQYFTLDKQSGSLQSFGSVQNISTGVCIRGFAYILYCEGNKVILAVYSLFPDTQLSKVVVYNYLVKVKQVRINEAKMSSKYNVLIVIEFANSKTTAQTWNFEDTNQLVLTKQSEDIISINFIAQQTQLYSRETLFLQIEGNNTQTTLKIHSSFNQFLAFTKIPSNYFSIKIVSAYIFIFTQDQQCIIYDSSQIRSNGLKLISILYLPQLTDFKSKIVIVPEYKVVDEEYGIQHIIYVRTNDGKILLYQTIDRIRKYQLNSCCHMDKQSIKSHKFKPKIMDEASSKLLAFIDKDYSLTLVIYENPKQIHYDKIKLPNIVLGSQIIDIHLRSYSNDDNFLIKYKKNGKYYLSKDTLQNLRQNKTFQWTYSSEFPITVQDINFNSDLVFIQHRTEDLFLFYYAASNSKNEYSIDKYNQLGIYASQSGRILLANYIMQDKAIIELMDFKTSNPVKIIQQQLYNICAVTNDGHYYACQIQGILNVYQVQDYNFNLIFSFNYTTPIHQLKFLDQDHILVINNNSAFILRNWKTSQYSRIQIMKTQKLKSVVYDFGGQIIAFSDNPYQLSIIFYNGTQVYTINSTKQLFKHFKVYQNTIYTSSDGISYHKYQLAQCLSPFIIQNNQCVCKGTLKAHSNQCKCDDGQFVQGIQCNQCGFLCSKCEESSLNCTQFSTVALVVIIIGGILIGALIGFSIFRLRRWRKNRESQSLLSNSTIFKPRSDIFDQ